LSESLEATLVRRCQARDKEAFRMLLEQYGSVLFGTAYLIMRDKGLAEDVVQEALIQIWKYLPSFHFKSSIKTWMVRIVINEARQQMRKKKWPTVPLESANQEIDAIDETDTELILNEERQSVREALNRLQTEHREAVILHYYSDLTIPEIAAVTGQREGTIKSRLSRALKRLGEILGGEREREVGR
jgi:RNA polymerase sigma-70 factor, ECF subfamily